MKLARTEYVVSCWAEACKGPGWAKQVVWVLVENSGSKAMRKVCLQPKEQSDVMRTLFHVSNSVNRDMTREAFRLLGKEES